MSPVSNFTDSKKFGPEKRLHFPWEYRKFFGKAFVYRAGECTIFRIPNNYGHFRVGITIKARGSSVERNRVKRQIREAFRHSAGSLGSFDYNVVVPASRRMDFQFSQRLGRGLLDRLGRPPVLLDACFRETS